jgi:hypothetical protein
MSILRRIKRYVRAQRIPELSTMDRVGMGGEQYADQFLVHPLVLSRIANPVLPHPSVPNLFLESDFLVYAAGTLFCLEIKNYKGIIYYPNADKAQIVQQKIGRYGENIPAKWHRNPLHQVTGFIFRLKQYLGAHVDPRFAGLYIVPVVAFVRNDDTDISSIWNLSEGMLYVDEISTFFYEKRNPKFLSRPSQWVLNGLQKVPRPDILITATGDVLHGFISHSHLSFKENNGRRTMEIPFAQISEVCLNRKGTFSDSDQVVIALRNGQQLHHTAVEGKVRFRTLHGDLSVRYFHNLASITPGCPPVARM